MVNLSLETVEKEITDCLIKVKNQFKINADINGDFSPGGMGIASQVLLTIMGRIGRALGVTIPLKDYIFHDKKSQKQLTIKEAAQKLIKVAKDGK